jgi:hypothetical protein
MSLLRRFRESFFLYSFLRDPVAIGSFIIAFFSHGRISVSGHRPT